MLRFNSTCQRIAAVARTLTFYCQSVNELLCKTAFAALLSKRTAKVRIELFLERLQLIFFQHFLNKAARRTFGNF
jgi:hypothetical protein